MGQWRVISKLKGSGLSIHYLCARNNGIKGFLPFEKIEHRGTTTRGTKVVTYEGSIPFPSIAKQ